MTAELTEKSYILGYWFASDGKDDWYLMVWKDNKDDETWKGQYTHRYHKGDDDDDPFSGKDEKSVYSFTTTQPEEEVISIVNKMFEGVKIMYNHRNDFFLVKDGLEKFMEIGRTKDYLHFKEVGKVH